MPYPSRYINNYNPTKHFCVYCYTTANHTSDQHIAIQRKKDAEAVK